MNRFIKRNLYLFEPGRAVCVCVFVYLVNRSCQQTVFTSAIMIWSDRRTGKIGCQTGFNAYKYC